MNIPKYTIPDQQQRERALDPSTSFIVQAPAGSGKTELLVQRFLTLLARVNTPEEILAITFTRKAAAEMRARILRALKNAVDQVAPESLHAYKTDELSKNVLLRDHEKKWALLDNPNRLRIQTIDAFCAGLTRQMPIFSRLGALLSIADDPTFLYKRAIQETLIAPNDEHIWNAALKQLLIHLDNDYAKVESLLIHMLACRDQWLPYLHHRDMEQLRVALEKSLQAVILENLKKARDCFPKNEQNQLIELARFAGKNLLAADSSSAIVDCATLNSFDEIHLSNQRSWLGFATLLLTKNKEWRKRLTINEGFPALPQYKNEKQILLNLLQKFFEKENFRQALEDVLDSPPPHYSDSQWKMLTCLWELLPILVAQLKIQFQQHHKVDHIEISTCARNALGETDAPTDLALILDYRLQHILVDEFQDTSITQFRLLEQLTSGWQAENGRTLFLVGDPMQSIYRFRKAEVGLFLQVRQNGIGDLFLESLQLTVNFRSTPELIAWFNKVFSEIFPSTEDSASGAITYCPADVLSSSIEGAAVQLHPYLDADYATEAKQAVKIVQETLQENNQQKIAILVRAKTHLNAILPALQAADIPYCAIEIEVLAERPVIMDLLALTRALLYLSDRIAWLAVLRAPWCGLKLADLHVIAATPPESTLWDRLLLYQTLTISEDAKIRLARVVPILSQGIQHRRKSSLSVWIENTWQALGAPFCLLEKREFEEAATFFKLLMHHEKAADIQDFQEFTQQLKRLFAPPADPAQAYVEIMTIHKAKGLEFDVVILPGLGRESAKNNPKLLLWMERPHTQRGVDLLLAPIKEAVAEDHDFIYRYLHREEQKKSSFEQVRLLYVAATRAKKQLHLLGHYQTDSQKPSSNSLLGQLWKALSTDFLTLPVEKNEDIKNITPLKVTYSRLPLSFMKDIGSYPPALVFSNISHLKPRFQSSSFQREIGVVIHRLLHRISLGDFSHEKTQIIVFQLRQLGVPETHLSASQEKIKHALTTMLDDDKGRWILQPHRDARSEYPITAFCDNELVSLVLDRTFIDDQGIRWIIDYKTHDTDDSVERYRPQLEQYAAAMQLIENRPIRLGIYFPLLAAWREWEYT